MKLWSSVFVLAVSGFALVIPVSGFADDAAGGAQAEVSHAHAKPKHSTPKKHTTAKHGTTHTAPKHSAAKHTAPKHTGMGEPE